MGSAVFVKINCFILYKTGERVKRAFSKPTAAVSANESVCGRTADDIRSPSGFDESPNVFKSHLMTFVEAKHAITWSLIRCSSTAYVS